MLAGFVDGVLDEPSRATVDGHLASCAECRSVVGALGAVFDPRASDATVPESDPLPGVDALVDMLASARVGEVIGETWRLTELLGTGGMGQVFAATHVGDGSVAAVKLLRPELSTHREIVRRFVREQLAANRIGHPAFVRVIDDGTTAAGSPYFAMDLVVGTTLRRRVREEGPLTEERATQIGAQLLDAVAAAHAAGVLHRDIKPDNIAIDERGAVRILDFGIARLTGMADGEPSSAEGLTVTGQMLGTPTYMPPEQARALPAEIDERVDVFAIGATLFFAVTGKAVRPATGALFEAMTQPVAPVRSMAPAISPKLARVLDRALAFDKRDRYATAKEMREALLGDEERATARPAFLAILLALVALSGLLGVALFYRAHAARQEGRATEPIALEPQAPTAASSVASTVASTPARAPEPSVAAAASAPRIANTTTVTGAAAKPKPPTKPKPPAAPEDPLERRR